MTFSTSYAVSEAELPALELRLESACGPARVGAMVELAWHLRQRDSARAQDLVASAERRLAGDAAATGVSMPKLPAQVARALTARLSLTACDIATMLCRLDEAQACLDRARAHLEPALDPHAEGDAWLAEAALAKATAQRSREVAAHERGMAFFADSPDRQRAGLARGRALCERIISQSRDQASAQGDEAGLGAWPEGGPASDCMRLALEGFSLSLREPAKAAALFAQAAPLARDMGLLQAYCILMVNAGNGWLELGDLERAAEYLDDAANQAGKTGWPMLIGTCLTHVGSVLRHLGRHQDSQRVLNAALGHLRATRPGVKTAMACSDLALTLVELGQDLEAIELMDEAIGVYRDLQSYGNLALHLIKLVRALARVRDAERALLAADEARLLIERHGYTALSAELSEALAMVHRRCKLPPPPEMSTPTAAIHFAQTALNDGMSVPGWKPPPELLNSIAEAWAEADDMTQAYAYARQAHLAQQQDEQFKTMNPQAMLRLVGHGTASNQAPPSRAPTPARRSAEPDACEGARLSNWEALTAKEMEVLGLLARNYSNKEIAQLLGVSAETIKWHLKGLYGKLNASSRKHAVTRARTLGMIELAAS
ncbi:MAG TPA: helix-turn-helix transcriptional regulator [Burkholderiaceae bacterium]